MHYKQKIRAAHASPEKLKSKFHLKSVTKSIYLYLDTALESVTKWRWKMILHYFFIYLFIFVYSAKHVSSVALFGKSKMPAA